MKSVARLYEETVKNYIKQGIKIKRWELEFLVWIALKHEEITQSRAAELLGISIRELRKKVPEWEGPILTTIEKLQSFYDVLNTQVKVITDDLAASLKDDKKKYDPKHCEMLGRAKQALLVTRDKFTELFVDINTGEIK